MVAQSSRELPFLSRCWLSAAIVASAALLSACSTPSYQRAALASDASQTWSGRLGLQVHDPMAQEQSFSASFHLQGSPTYGSLDVFNPLGSQIAQLQWQPGSAVLQQGDQRTISDSLEVLLQQSLGTALPVAALFSWLQGQNATAPGWQVDISRHAQGRITALRSSPLPQATLRVVLDQ